MFRKYTAVATLLALFGAGSSWAVNSLTVNGSAALGGSFGLQVSCDPGATNAVYVQTDEPANESHYKASFLMRPHTIGLSPSTAMRMAYIITNPGGQSILLFLRRTPIGNYALKLKVKDETSGTYVPLQNQNLVVQGSEEVIKKVTIEWQSDSSNGAGDGYLKITRCDADGVSNCVTRTLSTIDNDQMRVDYMRIGVLGVGSGAPCTSAGAYNFDEFESYR